MKVYRPQNLVPSVEICVESESEVQHVEIRVPGAKNGKSGPTRFVVLVRSWGYAHMQILVVQILVHLKWFFGHNSVPRPRTELKMCGNSSQ